MALMTSKMTHPVAREIESHFGEGRAWTAQPGLAAMVWETPAYQLLWADGGSETDLRKIWEARQGRRGWVVVLLAASSDPDRVRVVGPQPARPMRELPAEVVWRLLRKSRDSMPRDAAALFTGEFGRLEESVVPGIRVKDLLTPHFVRDRLRRPENKGRLADAVASVELAGDLGWHSLFGKLGYRVQQLPRRGYLLRHDDKPVAVVHPYRSPSLFSRLTRNGELPEGLVLADCQSHGARWAVLAYENRYRLFSCRPPVGSASGQYVELDAGDLGQEDLFYLGLLSPKSLREGGWLTKWLEEAKDFGEELRKGLEERLIKDVLPRIARGLGQHLESQGADLSDSEQLRRIEEAALTLVFRFMFLLHTEARGHLPVGSGAYRPHSARQLAQDSLEALAQLSPESTQRWDRLRTLVRMVRNGDRSVGVPVYNGSLFAADGFPGGDLLERAEITDDHLAPALVAVAYKTFEPKQPGLDYAGLQIGHLGAIYEALLSLRLTRAPEDLAYDDKKKVFRPVRDDEEPEVAKAQLYYQSQAGGRKAGGVFYTRHKFVKHLLEHSLAPAFDDHLKGLQKTAEREPDEAARRLFDFSVVDPAMGSAHFLTAALDMMADRVETFLAEVGGLPPIAEMLGELARDAKTAPHHPEDGDLLRRLILKRCIYGVDLSPMAVEMANITLWLASFVPGLALSYLGSNLKCGNALIGVADCSVVGANDSPLLTGETVNNAMRRAAELQHELAENPDRTPEEVKRSEQLEAELREATVGLRRAFDLWAAEPLGVECTRYTLETNLEPIVENNGGRTTEVTAKIDDAEKAAERFSFFHWPLEFPNVFHRNRPGFDVVVGNPPWNKVKFETPSFLAIHDPGIRGLRSGLERDGRAERLFQQRPELRQEMEDAKRRAEEERNFFKPENGYTIQGRGDADLYKLFCERYASILRSRGFMGVVLPRVAFLNDGSRGFRRWLFKKCRPGRVDALLNNKRWAFDIHPQWTIALLTAQAEVPADGLMTVTGPARDESEFADCIAGPGVQVDLSKLASWTSVPANGPDKDPGWELPLLPTQQHADVLGKLRLGVRFDKLHCFKETDKQGNSDSSTPALYTELHEAKHRELFTHPSSEDRIPVWKGRSFDQYEPHGHEPAGFCAWTDIMDFVQANREGSSIFKRMFSASFLTDSDTHPIHKCRIAFRNVTRGSDSRTVKACLVPPRTPLTDKAPYIVFKNWKILSQAGVLAVLNSLPFDWMARRYVETTLNYFILNSLTFPPPDDTPWEQIGSLAARLSCVDDRFVKFAAEAGVECGPLTYAERDDMRAEVDALVARAYGLTADELGFVFTDFTEKAVSAVYRERVLDKFESL